MLDNGNEKRVKRCREVDHFRTRYRWKEDIQKGNYGGGLKKESGERGRIENNSRIGRNCQSRRGRRAKRQKDAKKARDRF